jgi:hypothetical protein
LLPCGTSKWVHRECLNRWRSMNHNPAPPAPWAEEIGDNYQRRHYDHDGLKQPAAAAAAGSGATARFLSSLFLPVGFPSSVREEYLEYQFWDTVQALSSYLRGIFSTRAVLASAGVGDESASPLAAAVTWVLRDGLGMVGSLSLGYAAGSSFDCRLKEWRLFADVANDVGLTLDMVAPLVDGKQRPRLFFGVLAGATVCKAMCGVAAGSTKSSITAHMATSGNTADVAAKEGAQETFVTLVGIVAGVALARWLDDEGAGGAEGVTEDTLASASASAWSSAWSSLLPLPALSAFAWSWVLFLGLTAVHVYANWRGVTALKLRSLNRHRVSLLLEVTNMFDMLASIGIGNDDGVSAGVSLSLVAEAEAQLSSWLRLPQRVAEDRRIVLGAPLERLLQTLQEGAEHSNSKEKKKKKEEEENGGKEKGQGVGSGGGGGEVRGVVDALRNDARRSGERYLIGGCGGSTGTASNATVVCVLLVGASALDELRAYVHCRELLDALRRGGDNDDESTATATAAAAAAAAASVSPMVDAVAAARKRLDAYWPQFVRSLKDSASGGDGGWDLERVSLGAGMWRCSFEPASAAEKGKKAA